MFNSVSRTYCHVTAIFIRILVCDTLTVLRCDRMPFFTRGQGKIFRDPIGGKCLSVKDMFHLTQSSHSFPDSHHRPMYFPPKYKIARLLFGRRESRYFRRSFHSYPGGGCNLYEARSSQKLRFLIMKVFCLHIRSMNLKANSGWLEGPLNFCAEKYKPQEEFLNNTRLEGLQFPLISKF